MAGSDCFYAFEAWKAMVEPVGEITDDDWIRWMRIYEVVGFTIAEFRDLLRRNDRDDPLIVHLHEEQSPTQVQIAGTNIWLLLSPDFHLATRELSYVNVRIVPVSLDAIVIDDPV